LAGVPFFMRRIAQEAIDLEIGGNGKAELGGTARHGKTWDYQLQLCRGGKRENLFNLVRIFISVWFRVFFGWVVFRFGVEFGCKITKRG
jgi:hypothetical protein